VIDAEIQQSYNCHCLKLVWLKPIFDFYYPRPEGRGNFSFKNCFRTYLNFYFTLMVKLISSLLILFFQANPALAQQRNHREIYIFTIDAANASFINQKSVLTDAAGLQERDIQIHEIVGLKANESVFKKYKASAQKFTFVLFGKDGGEKLRSYGPVSLEKLYRTIDDMPMRKAEMKQGKH